MCGFRTDMQISFVWKGSAKELFGPKRDISAHRCVVDDSPLSNPGRH